MASSVIELREKVNIPDFIPDDWILPPKPPKEKKAPRRLMLVGYLGYRLLGMRNNVLHQTLQRFSNGDERGPTSKDIIAHLQYSGPLERHIKKGILRCLSGGEEIEPKPFIHNEGILLDTRGGIYLPDAVKMLQEEYGIGNEVLAFDGFLLPGFYKLEDTTVHPYFSRKQLVNL